MFYKKRILLGVMLLLGIILLHLLGVTTYINLETVQAYAYQLQKIVKERYVLSVLIYIGLLICAIISALPITILLTVTSGFLFGVFAGALYTIVGASVGGLIVFLLVRYIIGNFVQKRYALELQIFNKEIELYGKWYLLAFQILPMTPVFLPYALPGLSRLRWWTVTWITALGVLPGTLIYTWMGNQLHVIRAARDLLSVQIIVVLFLMALVALLPVLWFKNKAIK